MTELQILNDHQLGKTGGGVYNSLKHQWLIDLNLIPGAKSRDHIPKDNFSLPLLYPCHQRSIGDRRSSVTSRCSLKRDLVVIIISSSGSLTSRLRGTNSLQLRLPLDTFQSKIRLTAHFPSQKLVFFQTLMYRLTPGSVELCAVCWQHSDRLLGWWSFFFSFPSTTVMVQHLRPNRIDFSPCIICVPFITTFQTFQMLKLFICGSFSSIRLEEHLGWACT